jgi:transcription initiation factor TFIIB
MYSGGQTSLVGEDYCRLCLGALIWDQTSGETVCTTCGAVSAESTEGLSQIRLAVGDGNLSEDLQASNNIAAEVGVSTVIGSVDIDATGRRIGQSRDLRQLRRLNTIVSWDSDKRRLGKVSMEVRKISHSLGLNGVVAQRAFEIYQKEFDAKSVRARSLVAASAACVCMACRELEIARPPNSLVALKAGINERKFGYYYGMLLASEPRKSVLDPAKYLSSIAARASLRGTTERMAVEILRKIKADPRLAGKRPVSIAAAALYIASVRCGDRTTQLRFAYAAGVTPITIRKRSQEISEILGPAE